MSTDLTKGATNDAARDTARNLYKEHGGPLRQYALRIVPASYTSEAEDAVQETFAQTLRHLNDGKSITWPRAFLSTLLRALVYKMFYNRKSIPEIEASLDMDQFEADEYTCSPEHRVLAHQQREAFNSAVAQIPESYRQAFIMRRVYGSSCKEIAEVMGVSESVVQNRAAMGCKLLVAYCEEHNIVLDDYDDRP